MALEVFKVSNRQGPVYLHNLICFKIISTLLGILGRTEIFQVRTSSYGLNSFRYTAAILWNSLPQHFMEVTNFNQFKSLINAWNGESCNCTFCSDN